ncbi:MAG: CHAT domain-containing tetratricopeptide repeat protein [Cyclobacteriaceae bacterium]
MKATQHRLLTPFGLLVEVIMLLFFSYDVTAQSKLPRIYFSLVDSANNLAKSNFKKSDSLYNEAEVLIRNYGPSQNALIWINLQHYRASAAFYSYKFSHVQKYINEAYASIEKFSDYITNKKDSLKAETKFIQAVYFNDIGKYDHALENLIELENYIKGTEDNVEKCKRIFQIIQYQAYIYQVKGEYESAVNGYLSSIPYYDCYRDKIKTPNYLLIYRNIAVAYQELGNSSLTHYYFSQAIKNLNNQPSLTEHSVRSHALVLYNSIGEYFILQGAFDSAKFYYQKSIQFLKDNPILASRIYQGLAKLAQQEKDFNRSLSLFFKTLEIVRNSNGEKHYITGRIYKAISNLHLQNDDLENSLMFIQKAINCLTGPEEIKITEYRNNPSLRVVTSNKEMLELLHQKALLLNKLYLKTNSEFHLIDAQKTNLLSIQLLDSTRNEFTLEKDKVVLGEEAVRIYETSIRIAYELYRKTGEIKYLNECFELMDKSKSAVLLDHLKLVKDFSRIPGNLLERERELKAELTVAEEKLFKAESKQEEVSNQRRVLGDLKKAHAALFTEIETSYPQYYNLRIQNKILPLHDVQTKLLSRDQAMIQYFIGDTSIYMVCITPKKFWIYTSSSDSLHDQVVGLRDLIIKGNKNPNGITRKSNILYNRLALPWIDHLDSSIKSLIIIPHGILLYLPFEVLSDGDQKDVLLNRFSISYAASASLLREQKQMDVSGHSLAGFNADYTNNKHFPPLKGSLNEVESIQDLFGENSKIFTNSTADEFRKEAPQYKVLHLALHSYINDKRPLFSRLVFTSRASSPVSEITANDLYAMELNADLAVLSACESGIGQLHRGEGMMSLSRAFMYAGVPSTVISLWKVPDLATSLLMTKFYQFLKLGQSKDLALSNAKREFIKDYPAMSAPLFWAGFVVNGKTDPVSLTTPSERLTEAIMGAAIFILAVILIVILWRRYKLQLEI